MLKISTIKEKNSYLVIALANVAIVVSPAGIDECPGIPVTESSTFRDPFSDVPTLIIKN